MSIDDGGFLGVGSEGQNSRAIDFADDASADGDAITFIEFAEVDEFLGNVAFWAEGVQVEIILQDAEFWGPGEGVWRIAVGVETPGADAEGGADGFVKLAPFKIGGVRPAEFGLQRVVRVGVFFGKGGNVIAGPISGKWNNRLGLL